MYLSQNGEVMDIVEHEREVLKQLVLAKYLSGVTGPTKIAMALGLPELADMIQIILHTSAFQVAVRQAKRDMATSVVDAIKARLHEYLEKMEGLALTSGDPRVQFQALKDLMDRGGTGAAKQISLTSPAAYKKTLEEFMEPEDGKEVAVGPPNPGPNTSTSP